MYGYVHGSRWLWTSVQCKEGQRGKWCDALWEPLCNAMLICTELLALDEWGKVRAHLSVGVPSQSSTLHV